LKESTIPNAGYGVLLRQDVLHSQLLLKYWERKMSMKEATRQRKRVLYFIGFTERLSNLICWRWFLWQSNHHIKRVPCECFCFDSKPTNERPYSRYAHRHLVAGFANSLNRTDCNCEFVTIGDCIYIRAKYTLPAGTEIFVYYNDDQTPSSAQQKQLQKTDRPSPAQIPGGRVNQGGRFLP
jgi:hypothetical protein